MIVAALEPITLTLELPWPPSTNVFLRHFLLPGRKHPSTCISEDGRDFLAAVGALLVRRRVPKIRGPVAVLIELHPPDLRKIDVDNRAKPILDALKRRVKDRKQLPGAWVFADDDSQVKDLRVVMRPIHKGGKAVVTIRQMPVEGGLF